MTKKKVIKKVIKKETPVMTLIPELKKAKEEKDNKQSDILTQKEVNELLDLLSCGSESLKETWKDANNMECAKSNLKKVKTPQGYFDVILNFVEEREEYKKMLFESRNTISELENKLKLIKDVFNQLVK